MPEHVRVSLEPELGFGARTLDHAVETGGGKWRAPQGANPAGTPVQKTCPISSSTGDWKISAFPTRN
jgi:hypothetical protein